MKLSISSISKKLRKTKKPVKCHALGFEASFLHSCWSLSYWPCCTCFVLLFAVVDVAAQNAASTTLCVELLSVLNNCGPGHGDVASSLLQVALQWIESSPMSVLLLPMMSSACQCLASTSHMARVVETCCDTYFSRGLS